MPAKLSPSALLSCAALGLACAAAPARAEDAPRASFERMLSHEASGHVVAAPEHGADPRVAPLRDGTRAVRLPCRSGS